MPGTALAAPDRALSERGEGSSRSCPLVSVVTVTYNGEATIEDTFRSIEGQDYPNIEYIVVDGGSTDRTVELARSRRDLVDVLVSEPDRGVFDGMNKGIRLARGEIVATLNSDDMYATASSVRHVVETMERRHLDAAYGDLLYIDPKRPGEVVRYWRAGAYRRGNFRHGWVPPHPTFFCRKQVYERFGYYHWQKPVSADFELMMRMMERHHVRTGYVDEILVKMRTGGKANVLKGILRGNLDMIDAFLANDLWFGPTFFLLKPFVKVRQLVARPGRTELDRIQAFAEETGTPGVLNSDAQRNNA